jgi:SSS family solute:Na+ symporter
MLLVSLGWYFQLIFSGLFVAPHFRDAELYTVAGYFGHRFGERPRFVMLVLSILFSVFVVAAQMAAFGTVVSAVIGDAVEVQSLLTWAIVIGGSMVVIYSTAGGLLAVIHTDVYQFIVLIFGFAVTLAACAPDLIQSWGTVASTVPREFFQPEGGKGWVFLVTTFLAFLLGETFAPGYATRYCVGKNLKETRLGIAGAGFFLALVFPLILFFIALYARVHFPGIEPQEALPLVVKQLTNPLVAGLMIGALLMAVMSSADSALNSSTAIFVKDLFEHQLGWKDTGDGRILRLSRICSVLLGVSSVLIAVTWPDIISLLLFTYHVWAPAVILPICVGVFSKHRSALQSRNIFITMIAATGLTSLYRLLPYLQTRFEWKLLSQDLHRAMTSLDPSVFGVATSIVVYSGLVLLSRNAPRKEA